MTEAYQCAPSMTDVAAFVDEQPIGSFQIRLLLACAAVLLLDGFDTQGIGYVAPELAHDWNLARGGLGPVFSAGLVGNMVGALLFGPLADRIGRKRIIVLSTAVFGLGTLATVFAQDIAGLLLIRFLTGLGLGAALPNAIALVSEFSPDRRRATMVMAMFVGFSVGSALSGLIAAALIPIFGWRSVFLIGGIAPLLMVPFLAARLPESVRFLALSGRADVRVAELLTQVAPSVRFPSAMRFRVREATLVGLPIAYLFNGGRALATLVLWAVFFMSLLDLYLLLNWLPTVLNDLGASVSVAAVVGAMLQVGGIVGTLTLGRFIDRFSFRALSLAFLIAAIAIAIVGFCGQSIAFAIFAISCAGFFLVGGHIAAIALAATYYPTMARSTGVGWAIGFGRIGSIVGPLIGGIMLARGVDAQSLFIAAAVPALVASVAALVLARMARSTSATVSSTQPVAAAPPADAGAIFNKRSGLRF
ncbi:MFS transporter [Bradyrhizobium japonicum]|nr:MFS transporter [Bradyrhizobium japonicum]